MRSGLGFVLSRACGILLALTILSCLSTVLMAQDVASLTGIVTDTTGAVVPGVNVKVADTKTNAIFETTTSSSGSYQFQKLLPGPGYKLTFSKQGFSTLTIPDIYLATGSSHTQDAHLTIGTTAETVEVNGAGSAVSLDTTDTAVSTYIDMNLTHELPVQIRDNATALATLQPGVVTIGTGSGSDTNATRSGAVTGARDDQNNMSIDGLDVNDFANGQAFAPTTNAPVDSIQEFRGETANPLSTEGRGSGSQIALTTKSGTNTWHGAADAYNRVRAYAANQYFNNLNGLPRTPLIRNQFGAALGGPILKDKLFFFFDYFGRRDDEGVSTENLVPLDTWRGDGPGAINGIPQVGYINNTAGCTNASRANTTPNCISYTPNIANSGQTLASLDPQGIGADNSLITFIDGRYPHANDLGVGDGINTGGFRFNTPAHLRENAYTTRIDYNLSTKMRLFGRVSILRENTDDNVNFPAPVQFPGDPLTHSIINTSYAYVVGHTWTISNTKVNQFVYGETRQQLNFPTLYNPTGFIQNQNFGNITSPFSNPAEQGRTVPIPEYRDDFTYTRGNHTIQVGGTFKPIKDNGYTVFDLDNVNLGIGGGLPSLTPNERPANILVDPTAANDWDLSFPFILGRFSNVSVNTNNDHNLQPLPPASKFNLSYRYYETEVYVQDSWRARNDLTFTYGLRYQYYSVPYEVNGLEATANQSFNQFFQPRVQAGLQGSTGPFAPVSFSFAGKANHQPGYYHPDWKDFAPRFSVAYNPSFSSGLLGKVFGDRKTVLRAGAGVVFDHTITSAIANFQQQGSGIFQNSLGTSFGDLATDPRFVAETDLPTGTQQPTPPTNPFTPFFFSGVPVGALVFAQGYGFDSNLKTPYSESITFGVQRELAHNFQLDVTYVGRFGRRLLAQTDGAQVVDFKDPASGQTLNQAFTILEGQIRSGAQTFTALPFFENQFTGGTTACQNLLGVPNCTTAVALANFTGLQFGGIEGTVLTEAQGGELAALGVPTTGLNIGVGIPPQYFFNAYLTNKGASDYNGLLASLHKKISHGLQFDFNYTYSHSIDNSSATANNFAGQTANFSGGLICDATNPRICRGNSEFDVTHVISVDGVYDLPFGRGRQFASDIPKWLNFIAGGWQLAGINSWQTGFAFPAVSNASVLSAGENVPPPFTGSTSALRTHIHNVQGTIQLFADPTAAMAAFSPPTGLQGGASRDNLRGPHFWNVDLSLNKHFPIHERMQLEFRAEAYNLFNHANFDLPGLGTGTADITNPGQFGVITGTAAARVMQLSLRLEF